MKDTMKDLLVKGRRREECYARVVSVERALAIAV